MHSRIMKKTIGKYFGKNELEKLYLRIVNEKNV